MSTPMGKRKSPMTAAQLRKLREAADLKQPEAAEKLDAPLGTYRGWEQGRRAIPGPVAKLARLLFTK